MALLITSDCVNCDACEPLCPNEAIYPGDDIYIIEPDCCTECVGHFEEPRCVEICPIGCIMPDLERIEGQEVLMARYEKLTK